MKLLLPFLFCLSSVWGQYYSTEQHDYKGSETQPDSYMNQHRPDWANQYENPENVQQQIEEKIYDSELELETDRERELRDKESLFRN